MAKRRNIATKPPAALDGSGLIGAFQIPRADFDDEFVAATPDRHPHTVTVNRIPVADPGGLGEESIDLLQTYAGGRHIGLPFEANVNGSPILRTPLARDELSYLILRDYFGPHSLPIGSASSISSLFTVARRTGILHTSSIDEILRVARDVKNLVRLLKESWNLGNRDYIRPPSPAASEETLYVAVRTWARTMPEMSMDTLNLIFLFTLLVSRTLNVVFPSTQLWATTPTRPLQPCKEDVKQEIEHQIFMDRAGGNLTAVFDSFAKGAPREKGYYPIIHAATTLAALMTATGRAWRASSQQLSLIHI